MREMSPKYYIYLILIIVYSPCNLKYDGAQDILGYFYNVMIFSRSLHNGELIAVDVSPHLKYRSCQPG